MKKCNTLKKNAENIEIDRLVSQILKQVEFLETLISDEQMHCWISKNLWEIRKEIQKEVAIFSGMEIIWDRQFGFLKETLAAPVSRFNIMIGRTLGGATVAFFQGILVLFISMLIGFKTENIFKLPMALLYMFLIAVFFSALGTAIASVLDDMQGFQLIMSFLVMPTFFLSGAIFPLDEAPKAINIIAKINPLSYGVDGIRQSLTGIGYFNVLTDCFILSIGVIVLLWLGAYLFSKIEV